MILIVMGLFYLVDLFHTLLYWWPTAISAVHPIHQTSPIPKDSKGLPLPVSQFLWSRGGLVNGTVVHQVNCVLHSVQCSPHIPNILSWEELAMKVNLPEVRVQVRNLW